MLQDVKPPNLVATVVEPLTPDEIDRLFSSINPNSSPGARNTVLISPMLDTGIRLSEAAGLHEHDVHVDVVRQEDIFIMGLAHSRGNTQTVLRTQLKHN